MSSDAYSLFVYIQDSASKASLFLPPLYSTPCTYEQGLVQILSDENEIGGNKYEAKNKECLFRSAYFKTQK